MKFNNRWIDPRITEVRPQAAQAYLLSHGWKLFGPAANPILLIFDPPKEEKDAPSVLLPLQTGEGALLQRMIDLIADLSRFEDRWAVDVLNDILRQPIDLVPANGPAVPLPVEPASK